MALIPAGEFLMGAPKSNKDAYEKAPHEEKPQHAVNLEAYFIDSHLVSVERYQKFMGETGYRPERWQDSWLEKPLQPIRFIEWHDILGEQNRRHCNCQSEK